MARELGWIPNAALARQMSLVRGLGARPSESGLAVIINKSGADLKIEHAPRRHLEGACSRARQRGYGVTVFNLTEQPLSPRRLRAILKARGIQGVVFVATLGRSSLSSAYLDIGTEFASSVVGVRTVRPQFHVSVADFLTNGIAAMGELKANGFTRPVAIIPRSVDEPLGWGFSAGIYAGHQQYFPRRQVDVLFSGGEETSVTRRASGRIAQFLKKHRPDAILTTDPKNVLAICEGIVGRIRAIPVFDLSWRGDSRVEGGIEEQCELVGAAGVDLVVAQLHRNEFGVPDVARAIQIPGIWRWT